MAKRWAYQRLYRRDMWALLRQHIEATSQRPVGDREVALLQRRLKSCGELSLWDGRRIVHDGNWLLLTLTKQEEGMSYQRWADQRGTK